MATTNENIQQKEHFTKDILKGISILTCASATRETLSQGNSEHLLENVLRQNLVSLDGWISKSIALQHQPGILSRLKSILFEVESDSRSTVRTVFSATCVLIVDYLCDILNARKHDAYSTSDETSCDSSSCPALSVQQQKEISTCVQFIVVLGMCPYLSKGVGLPISERIGPAHLLLATSLDTSTHLSEMNRIRHLMFVLRLFMKMMKCSQLKDLVVNKFLSDVFVVFLQVRHSAKAVLQQLTKSGASTSEENSGSGEASQSNHKQSLNVLVHDEELLILSDEYKELEMKKETMQRVVQECDVEFDKLIKTTNMPMLMKDCLCLLGFLRNTQGTKSVPWFRRVLVCILRDILMHPLGIKNLITAFMGGTNYDTKDWAKVKSIARIISHCPVTSTSVDHFYSSILPQLLDLIDPRESSVSLVVMKTVGMTIGQMCEQHEKLVDRLCFARLLAPLADCDLETLVLQLPRGVVMTDNHLTSCISHCHRLMVAGQDSLSNMCTKLEPVTPVLFTLLVHLPEASSRLKTMIRDLLVGYLNQADTEAAVCGLQGMVLTSCSSSAMERKGAATKDKQTVVESWMEPVKVTLELLKATDSESLNSDFFLALLKRLTSIVEGEATVSSDIILPVRVSSPEVKNDGLKELKEKVVLVSLISAVGEEFGSSLIHSTTQILTFTQVTLDRFAILCTSCAENKESHIFEWETLTMSLGLLSAVLVLGCKFSEEDKKILDSIVPLLTTLGESMAVELHIRYMANDLKVSVATRGHVSVNTSQEAKRSGQAPESVSTQGQGQEEQTHTSLKKPLIEVLSDAGSNDHAVCANIDIPSTMTGRWLHAMQDVCDKEIPIKGHGLIQLSRMLEDREEGCAGYSTILLKTFLSHLDHEDSYIYLASINGLTALSDLCHDEVVPALTSEFKAKFDDGEGYWKTLANLGEAIVKTIRRLGELAPRYRDDLLNCLLLGCRHTSALVRASSLSNLADACKLLRFSVSAVLQEVLLCCHSVLTSDPEPDPRRAAALTLTCLLQGLGKSSIDVLGENLKELYRGLKRAVASDSDEKVKVHAQLAMEELDTIMRNFLFPQQNLQKEIKILGYQQ